MNLKLFLLFLTLTCLPNTTEANDSGVAGEGGRWARLEEGKTTIQMVRESVQLDIGDEDTYAVQADFLFLNRGPASTIKMGFPETGSSGAGSVGKFYSYKTAYEGFRTWVDGKATPVKRVTKVASVEEYSAFWVKSVHFNAGQSRRVRVSYRAPFGCEAAYINAFCSYHFTGGNWAGKVKRSVLTVHLSPGSYLLERAPDQRKGPDLIYTWTNWEAEQNFDFYFRVMQPGWLAWDNGEPVQGLPVDVPGSVGAVYDFPAGVTRKGQAYINLREWASRVGAELQMIQNGVRVKYHGKLARYYFSESGKEAVLALGGKPCDTVLYVPVARLEHELNAKIKVDTKTRRIFTST